MSPQAGIRSRILMARRVKERFKLIFLYREYVCCRQHETLLNVKVKRGQSD